jgi:hypothetical protein
VRQAALLLERLPEKRLEGAGLDGALEHCQVIAGCVFFFFFLWGGGGMRACMHGGEGRREGGWVGGSIGPVSIRLSSRPLPTNHHTRHLSTETHPLTHREAAMVGATRRSVNPREDAADAVQPLRNTDLDLLESNRTKVCEQLARGLLQRVPPPPLPAAAARGWGGVFGRGGGKEEEEERKKEQEAAARRLLAREVGGFVEDLVTVLKMRYLISPVNALGETPADVAGAGGVLEETHRGGRMGGWVGEVA